MAMTSVGISDHLIRAELWSAQLKEAALDDMQAQKWVNWLTEFPDGTQFTIPSVGEASVQDISDRTAIQYESLDTGEFTFVIDEYVGSAHAITLKALEDSYYGAELLASFVPKQRRALMEKVETDILKCVGPTAKSGGGHTANSANQYNGFDHRYVGTGSSDTMSVSDFSYAKLALKKANMPMSNLVAMVDPTVAYVLENTANIANISNNPMWEGIVTTGLTTGMRFVRNIFGFDVYESNYLTAGFSETITHLSSANSITNGVQNIMFCADQSVLPIKGAWRRLPKVDSEFNKDLQQEEYLTTARYGVKLYRPENMITVLTTNVL